MITESRTTGLRKGDSAMTGNEFKKNVSSPPTWTRGLFILLFALIYGIAEMVVTAVVAFQFCYTLITGRNNRQIRDFGQDLSTFIYQIMLFLTYNSEDKPYPFGPWPDQPPGGGSQPDKPIDYSI
jgi:hypothetical protein